MFRTIYCFLLSNFLQFLKSGGVTKYIFWVCLKDISVPALNMNASRFLGQNKIHETQRNCIIEIWHEDGCNSHWQKNTSTRQIPSSKRTINLIEHIWLHYFFECLHFKLQWKHTEVPNLQTELFWGKKGVEKIFTNTFDSLIFGNINKRWNRCELDNACLTSQLLILVGIPPNSLIRPVCYTHA